MKAVLLDFNGTLFFDSGFHLEAWASIYRELKDTEEEVDVSFCLGPRNEVNLKRIAPWLTPGERREYSRRKEALYRRLCREDPEKVHMVSGAEELLNDLQRRRIPFLLASASISENVDFYFEQFALGRWFDREKCVYDDGSYQNKGEMHQEAAKRLGVALPDCLVVEDSLSAVSHARRYGAGCIIGIGPDERREELLRAGASRVIRDFTEFRREWVGIG